MRYTKFAEKKKKPKGDLKKKLGFDSLSLPRDIPEGLNDFYHGFTPLEDPDTGEPVLDLEAKHQEEVWNDQYNYIYRAYPKSQKIWLTTTFLFEDIKHALTDAMGRQIIITGQSEFHAKEHLADLKKYVMNSRYSDYLVRKAIPEIGLDRSEATSSKVVVMHNPDNPFYPTKIYAMGSNAGALISFKKVKHIHASDITRSNETPEKQKETIASMLSRLANSKGSLVLEAPFRGMEGPLFEQWEKFQEITAKGIDLKKMTREEQRAMPFYCKAYDYQYGIDAGCFTQSFIDGERIRQGRLFDMYYGAKPVAGDMAWFYENMFKTSEQATKFYGT